MATLGIYGDSFADDRHAWTERAVLTESAWSYMLGNDFDKHKNYAQCASSLYYSYSKFLSTHELYDRIVFLNNFWLEIFFTLSIYPLSYLIYCLVSVLRYVSKY